jgi:hypothetical protein
VPNCAVVVVAVPGMVLQARGRPRRTNSGGDGVPTLLFDPAESRERGSRVRPAPFRGRGALAVRE